MSNDRVESVINLDDNLTLPQLIAVRLSLLETIRKVEERIKQCEAQGSSNS